MDQVWCAADSLHAMASQPWVQDVDGRIAWVREGCHLGRDDMREHRAREVRNPPEESHEAGPQFYAEGKLFTTCKHPPEPL